MEINRAVFAKINNGAKVESYLHDAMEKEAGTSERDRAEKFYYDEQREVRKVEQAVQHLMEVVNHTHPNELAQMVFSNIATSHRYLQSELITTLAKVLRLYGQLGDDMIDPRNEGAVELAKNMDGLPETEPVMYRSE